MPSQTAPDNKNIVVSSSNSDAFGVILENLMQLLLRIQLFFEKLYLSHCIYIELLIGNIFDL